MEEVPNVYTCFIDEFDGFLEFRAYDLSIENDVFSITVHHLDVEGFRIYIDNGDITLVNERNTHTDHLRNSLDASFDIKFNQQMQMYPVLMN